MEINPVFRRESRVRWRGNRAFVLLALLATLLSLVMIFFYAISDISEPSVVSLDRLSASGHELFKRLVFTQLGAWLLIVPALAAPGIAFERERGLLEALQLSGMAPWRVALGKFAGVLLFSLLLLFVSAPPLALCFMIGGVAPSEFIAVLKLQITLIFFCAALGLYFSARARRPQEALRNTFTVLVLFLLLSTFGSSLLFALVGFIFTARLGGARGTSFGVSMSLLDVFYYFSPINLMTAIFDRNLSTAIDLNGKLAIIGGVSGLLLLLATRYAGRTLPDAQWQQRRRYLTVRQGRLTLAKAEDWSAFDAPVASPVVTSTSVAMARGAANHSNQQAASKIKTAPAWEVPLVSFIRFANPVLQREVRSLLRLRRFSPLVMLFVWLGAGIVLIAYTWVLMWMLGYPEATFDVFQPCAWLAMFIVILAAPLRGANAIARERESGTWENLRLSLLEPRVILRGKALAPLIFLSGVLLVASPLWLAGILSSLDGRYSPRGTMSFGLVMGTIALLYATTFLLNAWGLWWSWRSRSSATAMGWTIGSLLMGFVGLRFIGPLIARLTTMMFSLFAPLLLGSGWGDSYYPYSASGWIQVLNPWSELMLLLQINSGYGYYVYSGARELGLLPSLQIFMAICFYFFLGQLLLWHLAWCMKRAENLERETAPRVTLDEHLKNWLRRLQSQ